MKKVILGNDEYLYKVNEEGEEILIEENIFNSPIEKAAKLIVASKKLLDNENVVLTPHNAFNSIEAVERIINTTIQNILG